jgi:hypothetical protein
MAVDFKKFGQDFSYGYAVLSPGFDSVGDFM